MKGEKKRGGVRSEEESFFATKRPDKEKGSSWGGWAPDRWGEEKRIPIFSSSAGPKKKEDPTPQGKDEISHIFNPLEKKRKKGGGMRTTFIFTCEGGEEGITLFL